MSYKNYQYIDLSYLEEMGDHDPKFILEIARIFIDQIPKELVKLKTAIESNNQKETYLIAHKIKSSIKHIGIHSIFKAIETIESEAKQKEDLQHLLLEFETVSNTCYAAIGELEIEAKKITTLI